MATVTFGRLPIAKTITLTSATDWVQINPAAVAGVVNIEVRAKHMVLTNLSSTQVLYFGCSSTAQSAGEEFTLNTGAAISIDFTRSGAQDLRVRGTSGEKYAVFIQ